MKRILIVIGALVVLGIGAYALNWYIQYQKLNDPMNFSEVVPIEHASGIINWGDTHIYFDPVGGADAYKGKPEASVVLVTDTHEDHFSVETLEAVVGENTALIVPQAVKDLLPARLASKARALKNNQGIEIQGMLIEAVPMYNLPGTPSEQYHPKGRGNGYIVDREGIRAYIAGDTAGTPEMRAVTNIDIAFVPMNLPYTMTAEEAADAVLAFKPKIVYPYHYRGTEGFGDVEEFKRLVNKGDSSIEVVLANWYPNE